jgi:hypothetical protein
LDFVNTFRKKIKKYFFEKSLDKFAEMWYNTKFGSLRPTMSRSKQKDLPKAFRQAFRRKKEGDMYASMGWG